LTEKYNIPKFVVQKWVRPIKNGVCLLCVDRRRTELFEFRFEIVFEFLEALFIRCSTSSIICSFSLFTFLYFGATSSSSRSTQFSDELKIAQSLIYFDGKKSLIDYFRSIDEICHSVTGNYVICVVVYTL